MPPSDATTPARGLDGASLAAYAAAVLLLGLNFVAVRFSNRELAPFLGAGARFALASLVLTAIVAARGVPFPRGRALRGTLAYGALSFFGAYAFLYWGLLDVPAGMAAVLFATVPLLTLAGAVAVGLERFRGLGLAGAILAVLGTAVVFREQVSALVPALSLAAVLAGAACAAASSIVVKRAPRVHPLAMNAVGMAVGAAGLLAASLLTGEAWALPQETATWSAFAYLVMSSVIAFVLIVWILSRWTASAVSYMGVLMPFVAIAAGVALAGETVSATALAGGALVAAGVYVGVLAGRPRAPAAATPAPAAGGR